MPTLTERITTATIALETGVTNLITAIATTLGYRDEAAASASAASSTALELESTVNTIVNVANFQLKRLHFRACASERLEPPEADSTLETVADLTALNALAHFSGQAWNRFVKVTSTGDTYMAHSDGTGIARWISARTDVLHVGDSMALLKFAPLWRKLWKIYGYGGMMTLTVNDNQLSVLPGMVLGGGAAYAKSANGPGDAADYAFWPNGQWVALTAGQYIEVGSFDDGFETQIFRAFYYRESGAGVVKVQSRTHDSTLADEAGYDAIDANGSAGAQTININKTSKAKRKFRIVGVSGTVKVFLVGALNPSGFAFYQLSRGGCTLADWNLWPAADCTAVLQSINPALITHDWKDVGFGDDTSAWTAALAAFEAKLVTASLSTSTDVLYLGASVTSDGAQATQSPPTYVHALAYGRLYLDMAALGETYAKTNTAFGGYVDGTHLYGPPSWSLADAIMRALRLEGGARAPERTIEDTALVGSPTLRLGLPLLDSLRGAAAAQKREHAGFKPQTIGGNDGYFVANPTSTTTGDFTVAFWVTFPLSNTTGSKGVWRLSSSNTNGNTASSIGMEYDSGQDTLFVIMTNAANNGDRRWNARWVMQNYAGKTVLVAVKRKGSSVMINFDGEPLGNFYDARDALTGDGIIAYTESTNGTNPPAWSDALVGSSLLLGKGINATWHGGPEWHEAAIWSRALSDEELFGYRLSGQPPLSPLGLWRCLEGVGRYAYDDSGNGFTGTLTTPAAQQFGMWARPSKNRFVYTASLAFSSSISAGANATLTVTVAGAKVGDRATVNRADGTLPTAGLILEAAVTAADTVTVRYTNTTGGGITPGTQNHVIEVQRASA